MDIEKLSEAELTALLKKAEERLSKVRARPPRAEMIKTIEGIAKQNGYALSELFPSATATMKEGRKLGPVKVKYVHPKDPELRWSGRGSKPKWIVDLLSQGHRLEDLGEKSRHGQAN